MGRVVLLSDEVIDKIAAGEVVESPAAVVKELVENSLDAKATSICVEIKAGGFQSIRVDDDGAGMDQEDAICSLQRHTTSKIVAAEDLFSLDTMGFRGEALASIAAVSKLTLITRGMDDPVKLDVEGGKILSIDVFPREKGTVIEVRSLFYNTPARKAFQKTASASTAEIIRLILALSLSHPEIEFSLISQEKSLLQTMKVESGDEKRRLGFRLQNVLGESFFSRSSWVEVERGDYRIYGFIGSPEFVRPNRLGQYLFLNRRWVQSPLISAWVREAYGTCIQEGSHPHFMLHVSMPKDEVDVNVHPQKKEVRLRNAALMKVLLREAVLQGLSFLSPPPPIEAPSFTPTSFSFREEGFSREPEPRQWEQAPLWKDVPVSSPMLPHILSLSGHYLFLKGRVDSNNVVAGDEILIVDLSACYAKCLFDALSPGWDAKKIESAQLFLPITLEFTADVVARLLEKAEFLSQSGFEIRAVGESTIALDSYPAFLPEKDIYSLLQGFIEEEKSFRLEKERSAASFCSRFAKLRKNPFSLEEAKRIWEKAHSNGSFYCPLGSKLVLTLKKEDMESLFKRV